MPLNHLLPLKQNELLRKRDATFLASPKLLAGTEIDPLLQLLHHSIQKRNMLS